MIRFWFWGEGMMRMFGSELIDVWLETTAWLCACVVMFNAGSMMC